ncbi:MAG: polysaccharide biosynthesis/export family protein [Verrucomicrobiota bacterium]
MLKTMVMVSVVALACACSDAIRVKPQVFREVCKDAPIGGTTSDVSSNLQPQVIAAGMQISVSVAEDSSLNRAYTIPFGCGVEFAGVGRIRVCGLTTDELTAKIKAALERDFFQHATVEVAIESVLASTPDRPQVGVVYVLGAVGRPGPMQIPESDFTVTKSIIAAGGFSLFAKGNNVKVVRYCEDGRKYETYIDVSGIMKNGDFERDVPLRDKDWVIVPQKTFSFF